MTTTAKIKISDLRNELKKIKDEVEDRVDRSKDAKGVPDGVLFAKNNPDIDMGIGAYITERYEAAEKLQDQIDVYLNDTEGVAEGIERFKELSVRGQQAAVNTPLPEGDGDSPSLVKALMESEQYHELQRGNRKSMALETNMSLKELFGSDSNATDRVNIESVRDGDYVPLPRTRVTLLDLIPQEPTTERVVKYDQEVKNLSAASYIAEGAAYAESEFQINEVTASVVKLGCYIQVSEELLDDATEMRMRLNSNLDAQMLRRIQSTVIGGAALPAAEYKTGSNADITQITGFLDIGSGNINAIDANAGLQTGQVGNAHAVIEQAVEKVYSNGMAEADAIVMHASDWVEYVTLQATTGNFIARGALEGTASPIRMQINGLPVVRCNALPPHTVLVGAFREFAMIRDKQDVRVRIQDSFSVPVGAANTEVQTRPTGRYNIFTDARMTFYARRGLAFCKITDYGVAAA